MPGFDNLLIVVAVAFAAPLLLGFFPSVKLPSVVVEIIAGIVIGPSVLGIVHADEAISVLALLGLAFLLFLAGLEIEFDKLRGQVLRLTLMGFAISFAIAVVVALGLKAAGLIETPLLIAIILCATSLGVLIPVLKDAGEISSTFGQLIVAAGTIADFGAVILLSIFFSGEGGVGSTLLLIGSLVLLAGVVFIAVKSAERSSLLRQDLVRLQDTTAQIRVRGAMVLLVGFAAIADSLGLESILGAFMAGAILSLLDQDEAMTHPEFRRKLEAIGFGVFIPVFFVTSGVNYDLNALPRAPRTCSWSRSSSPPCWRPAACPRCSTAGCSTRGTPDRRPDAGDLAAVHRRRGRDRRGPRLGRRCRRRRADRRRAALGAALPADRARSAQGGMGEGRPNSEPTDAMMAM